MQKTFFWGWKVADNLYFTAIYQRPVFMTFVQIVDRINNRCELEYKDHFMLKNQTRDKCQSGLPDHTVK